jgi:hypothetical protein
MMLGSPHFYLEFLVTEATLSKTLRLSSHGHFSWPALQAWLDKSVQLTLASKSLSRLLFQVKAAALCCLLCPGIELQVWIILFHFWLCYLTASYKHVFQRNLPGQSLAISLLDVRFDCVCCAKPEFPPRFGLMRDDLYLNHSRWWFLCLACLTPFSFYAGSYSGIGRFGMPCGTPRQGQGFSGSGDVQACVTQQVLHEQRNFFCKTKFYIIAARRCSQLV